MSDTPRTDEQELAYEAEDGSTYVHTTFARKLEREIDALRKDKERLDWVLSHEGRYWLSFREDIDREMKGTQ